MVPISVKSGHAAVNESGSDDLFSNHRPENVRDASVVVVSSAISADNPEIVAAHEARIPVIRRRNAG